MKRPIRFASVCDGISAVGAAWKPLGWFFVFKSEIEPFPSAVADFHHPEAPNLGDMMDYNKWNDYGIDLICGGTPCQAFSVAGLRKGLADPRGNLTLGYLSVIAKYRPRWVVWENVPGVLSDKTGAFGSFLGGLGELGYGFAYRILDAQYFGVAQRRRRVFVVGHIGGLWQRAAAVLFERDCLSWNPAPRRKKGEGFTHDVASCATASGRGFSNTGERRGQDPVIAVCNDARAVMMRGREGCPGGGKGPLLSPEKSLTLAANANNQVLFQNVVDVLAHGQGNAERASDGSPSLTCNHEAPIAFIPEQIAWGIQFCDENGIRKDRPNGGLYVTRPEVAQSLTQADSPIRIQSKMSVRRLTPRECERLQGFPDDYTAIQFRNKPAADGPRYKALGNSMAVPVMRWIGERIQLVEDLCPPSKCF